MLLYYRAIHWFYAKGQLSYGVVQCKYVIIIKFMQLQMYRMKLYPIGSHIFMTSDVLLVDTDICGYIDV